MSILGTLDRRRRADHADGDAPIDPRIEARRQAVVIERHIRRKRRLLILAATVTVAAGVYLASRSAAFDVDRVEIVGNAQTTPDDIRSAATIGEGDQLADLDLAGSEARVRALPWVATAQVTRTWRGSVTIAVTERVPAAALATPVAGGWLVVDDQRRVLGTLAGPPTELPVIEGIDAVPVGQHLDGRSQPALTVAGALTPGLRSRVASVRVTGEGAVELVVRPAGIVRVGTVDDLDQKVQSLQTIFGQVDLHCLASVDLRVPDQPVLTRDRTCA